MLLEQRQPFLHWLLHAPQFSGSTSRLAQPLTQALSPAAHALSLPPALVPAPLVWLLPPVATSPAAPLWAAPPWAAPPWAFPALELPAAAVLSAPDVPPFEPLGELAASEQPHTDRAIAHATR